MRKILALLLAAHMHVWAAACVLQNAGVCTGASCSLSATGATEWSCSHLPVDGDTVTGLDGKTLHVDQAWTIGDSANPTTPSIRAKASTSGTFALAIDAGVALTVHGNVVSGNANWTAAAGSSITFDHASAKLTWEIGDTSSETNAHLTLNGSSGSHVTVTSTAASDTFNGAFIAAGFGGTGLVTSTFADFTHIGDASIASMTVIPSTSTSVFSLTDSTCDHCGKINGAGGNLAVGATWIMERFHMTNTLATQTVVVTSAGAKTGGTRLIDGSAFDKQFAMSGQDYTFTNNYFGVTPSPSGTAAWASFANNLVYDAASTAGEWNAIGNITNSYFVFQPSITNPHGPNVSPLITFTPTAFTGLIFENTATSQDGDMLVSSSNPTVARVYSITNSLVLPGSAGNSPGELVSGTAGAQPTITAATNATPIVLTCSGASCANTQPTGTTVYCTGFGGNTALNNASWVVTNVDGTHYSLNSSVGNGVWTSGGSCNSTNLATLSFDHNTVNSSGTAENGIFHYGETFAGYPGVVTSVRSNIAWTTPGKTAGVKIIRANQFTIPDEVSAANADYNTGWGLTAGSYGKGYHSTTEPGTIAMFTGGVGTATPGAHDIDTNPGFLDRTRNLAAWSTHVGGAGTAVDALSRLATDPTLIAPMWAWVRQGFMPTNLALKGQGTAVGSGTKDGSDIGAVPMTTWATPGGIGGAGAAF